MSPDNDVYRDVGALRLSDQFYWGGRRVSLMAVEDARRSSRPGIWLHVIEDDGTRRRLHYYADERVRVP